MAKFMLLYRSQVSAEEMMANATTEQVEAGLKPRMVWFGKMGSAIVDRGARIAKGGAFVGTDKAVGTTWSGESYGVYGGGDDLWGTSWTPADINDPGFGAALSVGYGDDSGSGYAGIDTAWITVRFEVECK